jgi:hypothetical protein
MNARDAISAADLYGGDDEPLEACPDCGRDLPAGGDCEFCAEKRAEFEINTTPFDPRF